jgi:hypothetical protein
MRGRTSIFIVLCAATFPARLQAACIEPTRLAHEAVGITHYFDDGERAAQPGFIGTSGTAWFLSPTRIVTAEHVSTGMMLTTRDWKLLEIRDGDETRSVPARIARVTGSGMEKLAVLELQSEVPNAHSAAIRTSPLVAEDQVVTFAYRDGRPRIVGGRFVKYGDDERLAGTALLEMFDDKDRLAIDHGASGAPVYDCEGRIAGVVTTVITQMFSGLSGRIRVSTPWGMPNVLSVPIQALEEASEAR